VLLLYFKALFGGTASRLAVVVTLLASLSLSTGCGGLAARGLNAEGVCQFEQANLERATRLFQQAIYNDPDNADGYYNVAAAFHRKGTLYGDPTDFKQAESYYNQCLDRDANNRECHRGLAVLLVEQDRSEEAFCLLEGWVGRDPTLAAPKVELARLHEEFGDLEVAKEHLVKALAVEPTSSRALAALGRLREQTGDHAQALADYQRSLWHNRFQPEVAARVAALQSVIESTPAFDTTTGGTRTVTRNPTPLR